MAMVIQGVHNCLVQLAAAVKRRDEQAIWAHAGAVIAHVGPLLAARRAEISSGVIGTEPGRGDAALLASSIRQELDRFDSGPSAMGPPWDGSLLKILLEFIWKLLGPLLGGAPPSP